ncbi:unnamed protein product [Phytophthora fragariaefolia]|uniref:Unnamed protein product n=1 Tax=Phytophthora fragariaefolia TaxID=1490495 RepID=A0A9W6XES4_9STRA|nr:unnamed protein product [Phytophthora fragariaefolia]
MRILSSAITITAWIFALPGAAPTGQAYDVASSSQGGKIHEEDHGAGQPQRGVKIEHVPKGRGRSPHGPVNWPRGKQFGNAMLNAAGTGDFPTTQDHLDNDLVQADRRLRLRGRDDKP